MATRRIPVEALIELRQRLGNLPARSPERRKVLQQVAQLYGVSEDTMYRAMRQERILPAVQKSDRENRTHRRLSSNRTETYAKAEIITG